eukprot:g26924.t2
MVVKEVRRVMSRKTFPLLIQDCALWAGESPRHVDLSFPSAFNRAVAGNRPDFRAFDPVKNFHEGTGMVARADQEMDPELLSRAQERAKTGLFWKDSNLILRNEIRRMYSVIMMALGLDPMHQSSWELILRCFPCCVLPFPEEHLLSHHYFAREFLFDRGDLEGNHFGHPLSAKTYNRILNEIDGEVAVDANGAYDRKADVSQGFAQKRRQRARKLVELHVHLDGAFDRALLFELAKRKVEDLPLEVESAATGKAIPLREMVRACEGVKDFEKLITCRGSDPEPALAAVTRGLRRGCEEHQIVVNQIICCISFQPKWSLAIIDLAEKYRSAYPCAVVGVDVAAGEVGDDPVGHAEAFARAQALKLPVTLHAGEMGNASNVRHAVFDFGARRVGHGYAAADHVELMKSLVARGAHFEVCPTSSQETGAWRHSASSEEEPPWPSHPLRSMLEAGASVSINSDDPSVFLTTLSEEFWGLLWGMFFALDNAAEYGHWVVDDKAKNIFRNNFNTALSEQGTLRMLRQIHRKELRAHFHPTELFKGELGQVSWAPARDLVKPVYEAMTSGGDLSEVSPMLGVYNCYNCAKSPKGDPQQISDPLTVFEFLNFSKRYEKQDVP